MNIPFYFNKIRHAISDYQDNKIELYLREWRDEILRSKDEDDGELLPLLDFTIDFLNPIQRILCVVIERQKEENLIKNTKCDTFGNKYQLLTINQLFECMTKEISLSLAQYIIDQLKCSAVEKSDLKEAVVNSDFNMFSNTVRENNIDYTIASSLCSHLIYLSKNRRELIKNVTVICDEYDDNLDSNNFALRVCACYDIQLETILNNMREEGCREEFIEEEKKYFSEIFDTIKDFYRKGDIKNAMLMECIVNFANLCWPLHCMALDGDLLPFERQFLSDFIAKQAAAIPFVNGFLSLCTTGKMFFPGFDYAENVSNEDLYNLLGACISPLLPEDKSFSNPNNVDQETEENVIDIEGKDNKCFNSVPAINTAKKSLKAVFEKYPSLSTERAEKYLQIAIEKGFITIVDETQWMWNKEKISKVALAYLLSKIYFYDSVNVIIEEGKRKNEWIQTTEEDLLKRGFKYSVGDIYSKIELLFCKKDKPGQDAILQERRKRHYGPAPKNYKDIDKLFDDEK